MRKLTTLILVLVTAGFIAAQTPYGSLEYSTQGDPGVQENCGYAKIPTLRYTVVHKGYMTECWHGHTRVVKALQIWQVYDKFTHQTQYITVRTEDVGFIEDGYDANDR